MRPDQERFFHGKINWASHQISIICIAKARMKRTRVGTINMIADLNKIVDASAKALILGHELQTRRSMRGCVDCSYFEQDSIDQTTQCLALPSGFGSQVGSKWDLPVWCPLCGDLSQHPDWAALMKRTFCPGPHKVGG